MNRIGNGGSSAIRGISMIGMIIVAWPSAGTNSTRGRSLNPYLMWVRYVKVGLGTSATASKPESLTIWRSLSSRVVTFSIVYLLSHYISGNSHELTISDRYLPLHRVLVDRILDH